MAENIASQHDGSAGRRIVAAARKLFAERGFHQTAMADLAKEANVSVGAIYRSFASKADIILAIIVADSQELVGQLRCDVDRVRDGAITIEAAIEHIVLRRLLDEDEALMHEMLAEAHRNADVAASISDFCVEYRGIFSQLARLARPGLTDEELEGAAELLLACLFGLGHRQLTSPKLDERITARVMTRLILKAFSPSAEAA